MSKNICQKTTGTFEYFYCSDDMCDFFIPRCPDCFTLCNINVSNTIKNSDKLFYCCPTYV